MSMKIQNVRNPQSSGYVNHGTGVGSATVGEVSTFRRTLTNLSAEQHAERLKKMKEEIEGQAAKLSDRVDVREYEKYRRLIREFLDEIISNGYAFCREDSNAYRGRHRFFATVRTVDEKLDEIGKEVIKEQAEVLEILNRIDDIRGLLLDLML